MRIFRGHTSVPPGITSDLYRHLAHEWTDLHHTPSTTTTVRRWVRAEPVLAGALNPGEIVDRIDQSVPADKDLILLALLRLTQDGHQLAGRTVLQALLPRLSQIRASATYAGVEELEDLHHVTLAEFWDVMATYPADRRTSRVAANLTMDTLRRVRGVRQQAPATPVLPQDEQAPGEDLSTADPARRRYLSHVRIEQAREMTTSDELTVDGDLVQLLTWARTHQVITAREALMLSRVYLGEGYSQTATEFDVSQATLRQRCARTVRKLKTAVQAELTADTTASLASSVA